MPVKPVLLAVTSDHHANSTVGLCPGEGVQLDDGGFYQPSKPQVWLWDCWTDFWQKVRARRREYRAELFCVYNGDLVDGDHHQTSQIISRNVEVQDYIAQRVFSVPESLRPDRAFVVRGTEVHVGPSASHEELLAKRLRCERDPETQNWSSWHLRMVVCGQLLDFQHHGRSGTRPWTRANAVSGLAAHIWMEHQLARLDPPTLAFRSHRHEWADSYGAFPTRVIQTPAWQLKTAFGHRIAPESIADIGGVTCLLRPGKAPVVEALLYRPQLPAVRRP